MEESVRRPQEAHRRAAAGPGIIRGIKYPAPHVGGEPGDVGGNGGGGRVAAEKVVVVQLVAERALATVAAAGLEELAAAMEEVMVGRPWGVIG